MKARLRRRFYVELAVAVVSGALFLVAVLWKNWIEVVFGIDPDQNSGSLERLIVVLALVVAVTSVSLARRDWRRQRLVSA